MQHQKKMTVIQTQRSALVGCHCQVAVWRANQRCPAASHQDSSQGVACHVEEAWWLDQTPDDRQAIDVDSRDNFKERGKN